MTARAFQVSKETTERQARASDPAHSAWVSANAGSGKTTVLVRRVLRLLVAGVAPSRILCLTYTEAAAANMKNRLFAALRGWATLPDAALAGQLASMSGHAPSPAGLARARTLFATALETPGGLKIDTIHGFCTRVLQSAPFEANVPARFDIVQGADAVALLDEAVAATLTEAGTDPEAPLGRAARRVAADVEETRFAGAIADILADRELLCDEEGELLPLDRLARRLERALEAPPGVTEAEVAAGFLARHAGPERLAPLIEALAGSNSKNDAVAAVLRRLAASSDAPSSDTVALDDFAEAFLTGKGERRKDAPTASLRRDRPDFAVDFERLAEAYGEARDVCARLAARDRSLALITLAHAILGRYEALKARRRRLDFDDLIARTRSLLTRVESSWVLYKLDAGVDHLLIDEAQDTSRAQWAILRQLTGEFFAGSGAHEARRPAALPRTVFAVGDEKQSIYSFQKADPASFEAMRRHFERRIAEAAEAGHGFHRVPLIQSFRSTAEVMAAVDAIFAPPAHHKGLVFGAGEAGPVHETARTDGPGAIDLWPVEANDAAEKRNAWEEPVDAPSSAVVKLASRLARVLGRWAEAGCDDLGRPFDPGQVLILLRRRSPLFQAIVRELKQAGVPVAGVDRLDVASHIAVEDLVALGRATLLPADDLTLATGLKSPVFGLDDEHLMRIAPGRVGSLRAALAAAKEPELAAAAARLAELEQRARRLGPFGFYARLLGPEGGRKAILARLGAEAGDALDAFLATTLAFEQREGPSLAAFLDEITAGSRELKRDLAEASGEVRVMTVHGAKGLEAPVVIIPDLGEPGGNSGRVQLFELPVEDQGVRGHVPVWTPRAELHCAPTLAARDAGLAALDDERRRLFYVALTRAEDRLILCGANAKGVAKTGSWYDMARTGLGDSLVEAPAPDGAGVILRRGAIHGLALPAEAPAPAAEAALPGWALRPAPSPPEAATLSPSRAGQARGGDTAEARALEARLAFGTFVHRLLQHLPNAALPARPAVAEALARLHGGGLAEEARARAVALALEVLAAPGLAALFGPDSLAEVPVAGVILDGDGRRRNVSGRIDRLAIEADTVWLADYKTSERPPETAADIPPATLVQLALYHRLVEELYPGRRVRSLAVYPATGAALEPTAIQRAAALAALGG